MLTWWNSLTLTGQIFATIAIPATVIMAIQSLLLLFGIGFESDSELSDMQHDLDGPDFDSGDGLALFTVRGMVAFFSVGGWTGLVCVSAGLPPAAGVIIAFVAGSVALFGIALLFKYSLKLQDKGNLDLQNTLGKTGSVYIPIPKSREGQGKVTVMIQERLIEVDAMTDDKHPLKTGAFITVTKVLGDGTILVTGEDLENNQTTTNQESGGISKWISQ